MDAVTRENDALCQRLLDLDARAVGQVGDRPQQHQAHKRFSTAFPICLAALPGPNMNSSDMDKSVRGAYERALTVSSPKEVACALQALEKAVFGEDKCGDVPRHAQSVIRAMVRRSDPAMAHQAFEHISRAAKRAWDEVATSAFPHPTHGERHGEASAPDIPRERSKPYSDPRMEEARLWFRPAHEWLNAYLAGCTPEQMDQVSCEDLLCAAQNLLHWRLQQHPDQEMTLGSALASLLYCVPLDAKRPAAIVRAQAILLDAAAALAPDAPDKHHLVYNALAYALLGRSAPPWFASIYQDALGY